MRLNFEKHFVIPVKDMKIRLYQHLYAHLRNKMKDGLPILVSGKFTFLQVSLKDADTFHVEHLI